MVPIYSRSTLLPTPSLQRPRSLFSGVGGLFRGCGHPPLAWAFSGSVTPNGIRVRSGHCISKHYPHLLPPVARSPPDLPFFPKVEGKHTFRTYRSRLPPLYLSCLPCGSHLRRAEPGTRLPQPTPAPNPPLSHLLATPPPVPSLCLPLLATRPLLVVPSPWI